MKKRVSQNSMPTTRMIRSVLLLCSFAVLTISDSIHEETDLEESVKKSGVQRYRYSNDDVHVFEPYRALRTKRSEADCAPSPGVECDAGAEYRTVDGTCNNLQHPQWGSANTCQRRLMPPHYVGTSGFRQSVEGGPLPPARLLSLNLHFNRNRPSHNLTHLHMFVGQLIAHDITSTPKHQKDGQDMQCCLPEPMADEACKPIFVPEKDRFFSKVNVTCLSLARSKICNACSNGSKQVMDSATSFVDASFVYGTSQEDARSLRTNDGTGRLRVQKSAYGDLLPADSVPPNDPCLKNERSEFCFRAGDERVNQHVTLTCLQTVFMREHNRIVEEMARLNPGWDEEKLFQEARKIVGAVMQTITYKEYLPLLLGDRTVQLYGLGLSDDRRTTYEPAVNPTLFVEFTTGAFRLHSLINSRVSGRRLPVTEGYVRMRDLFFRPYGLYNGSIGPLMEQVTSKPEQQFDRFLVPDITNYALRRPGQDHGGDLAAVDISRGRDNGLPPYVDVVGYCTQGQTDIRSFEDLVHFKLMNLQDASALQMNYKNVRDVDLWSAMNMEIPRDGAVIGPTAACVVAKQFFNLKFGDRFYVEHGGQSGSFTDEQLAEIRQTGLSSVLCTNTDAARLPLNPMVASSESNPLVECGDVRSINLTLWKD